ncbi:Vacuolar membrane protein [Lachnellula suecica]|uniref:Vacuolar membrane protein n=1 Tax=Lachnellula suecica TaxID=602035 RepID=A0A8T9CK04_9HELO|nr:Vacuolar membrane protein [Lachnellula suecica]
MLPPPGFEPSVASFLENADPTSMLSSAIATASSVLRVGVDMPSSTMIAAVATAAAHTFSEPHSGKPHHPPPENGECNVVGPFAILVQGALGCMALLALVYKRWRERPQRPLKIWFFDVSKQVVGSVLVHIANLLMSMLSSGQFSIKIDPASVTRRMIDEHGKYTPNPCSFYLLNLAIDTTVGIPILIILLRIFTALFAMTPFGHPRESIESGNYGSPPRAWWWFKQSLIYFLGLMGMKFCVLIIFLVLPWISRVGDWALRWTEGDEALQVIFVMLIFPVIMNATQYYIIDSFIKKQSEEHEHERLDDSDSESDGEDSVFNDPARRSSDSVHVGNEDPEVQSKAKNASKNSVTSETKPQASGSREKKPRKLHTGSKDYDPQFDGESSPTVVGSASTDERDRLVQTGQDSAEEDSKKPGR